MRRSRYCTGGPPPSTPARTYGLAAGGRLRPPVAPVGQPRRPPDRAIDCAGQGGVMPYTPHIEHHFTGGLVARDTVIGLSDGLTVPFALAAAVTGAVDSTGLVVTAGLAEIAA